MSYYIGDWVQFYCASLPLVTQAALKKIDAGDERTFGEILVDEAGRSCGSADHSSVEWSVTLSQGAPMMSDGTRKPDFDLRVKVKGSESGSGRSVGAAWENENGGISIKLNPCVILDWRDDVHISLFRSEDKPWRKRKETAPAAATPTSDDPPFR